MTQSTKTQPDMPNSIANSGQLLAAAELLERDAGFRVIRRLDTDKLFILDVPKNAGLALVLDTETTGRGPTDRIIELGLVLFAYDRETGAVYGAIERFNELEDPGMPIDPEASEVNGITDEMVRGKRINDLRVQELVEQADFVIAHNASFDRPPCELRFPVFKDKAWVCSQREVEWAKAGIRGVKLEYIAYRLGFFYEAHRAEADCLALLHAVSVPLLEGSCALTQLMQQASTESRRVWAVNAPFAAKDLLKARGYRWSDGSQAGAEKAWFLDCGPEALADELAYLKCTVYGNRPLALPVDVVTAATRFSGRRGQQTRAYTP